MVRDYVTYTDGSSTQRLFELAARLAAGAEPLRDEDGHRATATGRVARVSE
jgi:hypothetical protein